jgi:hypothetical protein
VVDHAVVFIQLGVGEVGELFVRRHGCEVKCRRAERAP